MTNEELARLREQRRNGDIDACDIWDVADALLAELEKARAERNEAKALALTHFTDKTTLGRERDAAYALLRECAPFVGWEWHGGDAMRARIDALIGEK